jgi:hypothetical protein
MHEHAVRVIARCCVARRRDARHSRRYRVVNSSSYDWEYRSYYYYYYGN